MLGKKNSICLIQPSSQFVSEVPRNQSEKLGHRSFINTRKEALQFLGEEKAKLFLSPEF